MTRNEATTTLFNAMVKHVWDTDDETLRSALETLCPHTEYVHGGSMGLICAVCGLSPDGDVAAFHAINKRLRQPASVKDCEREKFEIVLSNLVFAGDITTDQYEKTLVILVGHA